MSQPLLVVLLVAAGASPSSSVHTDWEEASFGASDSEWSEETEPQGSGGECICCGRPVQGSKQYGCPVCQCSQEVLVEVGNVPQDPQTTTELGAVVGVLGHTACFN